MIKLIAEFPLRSLVHIVTQGERHDVKIRIDDDVSVGGEFRQFKRWSDVRDAENEISAPIDVNHCVVFRVHVVIVYVCRFFPCLAVAGAS